MKKTVLLISAMAVLWGASVCADAETIRYYDVSAYINNNPIPCYNINDYCGIFVKDLKNYGFNVEYNHESSSVNVTRDAECTAITGMGDVKLPYQRTGTLMAESGESSITVYLNGTATPSYWVDGNMMILLDNMDVFGEKLWDGSINSFFLTVPGLPVAEYKPLEKAQRTYRAKPETGQMNQDIYYSYPAEECDWGFVRVEGDEPQLYDWEKEMLAKYDAYYIDHSRPHKIYLTFDEGYEAGYTQKILDTLTKYDVPATFFVTGEYLRTSPELVSQMIDKGFTVGDHTENHKNLAQCDVGTIMNEIEIVSNTLRYDFGYETHYMRPPEGAFNERTLALANDMGYNTILWSFAYYDYDESVQKGKDYAYDMITKYMHDGALYLLHAVSKDNADALEDVILYAKEQGYEFGSLDDLCNP